MPQPESIYRDHAGLRWPEAHPIFGNGPFAIISRCPARPFVRLFEFLHEAEAQLRAPCGHAFCQGKHTFARLDDYKPTPPANIYRKKPHWAKMIDEEG